MFSDKRSLKRINDPLPECKDGHLSFFTHMGKILVSAALKGHSHCAKMLMVAGADVNTVSLQSKTPLSFVFDLLRRTDNENKRIKLDTTVQLLLKAGAHVNVKNEDGHSFLCLNEWQLECATGKLLLAGCRRKGA